MTIHRKSRNKPTRPPDVVFVALTFEDDSIGIMQKVVREYLPDGRIRWEQAATDAVIQSEVDRSSYDQEVKQWRFIKTTELPADRTFREAWRDTGKAVAVNMAVAREIHKENLRDQRKPLLAALDVEYQRADETGDTAEKKRIAKRKQELRDVTDFPAIAKAKTPDELKAVIPPVLEEK